MVRAHEDRGEERDVSAGESQNGTVHESERFAVLSWLNGFTFSFVEIFGIGGKRSWKEQQRQKKEVDNLHVNRPGLEFRLTLRPLKKIKDLPMQKSEKGGRISANLQPHATRK
jgi:hypothetical protein